HPFAARSVSYRNPVFVLDLAPGDQVDVLIRLDTHDGLYEAIPLLLWKEADFFSNTSVETLIFGCYYGGILALLLYNLLLFLSTRERLFALYAAYLASFMLWNFSFNGYAFLFSWPDAPAFGNQIIGLSGVAIFATLSAFSCAYLQTRTRTPRLHKLIVVLATLVGLHAVPAALDHYAATFRTLMPLGALLLFTLLSTAVYLMFRGYRSARFYALAWVFVIAGAIAYTLRVFDVLPANFLTEFSLNIGSALEFILLAFVLADRINVLKEEKLTLERHALAAQRARSAELEQRVNERTRELAAANAKLQELAVTDSLTGLHNRRYFNEALAQELDRTARAQVELGLIAINVDHFKRLNDRLGHQAGDHALVEVARIIRGALKRPTDF
ncbi:7TM diverse intracellular signaling domain-containing protein, partial [Leptospira sp. SA-E8]|uniref:sensor domain-containing diguanylate cyclase n=1 Tax=Leptospira sp. SA-E8 TaxID=3422259 RepID=UPI003EBC9E47